MPHRLTDSVESTCNVLTCTSDEFLELFNNDNLSTVELAEDVLRNVIHPNQARLRESDARCRLDDLLAGMLQEAPEPSGQRYAAVALHIAHEKGGVEAVVDIAKAWLDNIFLPMLTIARSPRTEPSSSQTPTIDTTVQLIEGAGRSEQSKLRHTVARREQNRCAITGAFDRSFVTELLQQSREHEIPQEVPQLRMAAAHIIPFLLNDFSSNTGTTSEITDAARSWDMLQSWTSLDLGKLVRSDINSPTNAIFMSADEHYSFKRFYFYLDKQAYPNTPNKYRAQMVQTGRTFTNGRDSSDVEFRAKEDSDLGVEAPDPHLLRIHAAFAKVLNLCGAAEYLDKVERDGASATTLRIDGTTDFGSFLMARLPVAVYSTSNNQSCN